MSAGLPNEVPSQWLELAFQLTLLLIFLIIFANADKIWRWLKARARVPASWPEIAIVAGLGTFFFDWRIIPRIGDLVAETSPEIWAFHELGGGEGLGVTIALAGLYWKMRQLRPPK